MLYYSELFGRNKKKYRVELLTDGDRTEQQELQMAAGSPIVRIDGTEDIFTPLHGGSASITIRTDELLPFYTADPMGVSATIYEDDSLLFYGYATPNVYSSVWMPRKTDLTIECRDALSVLADLEYDSDNDTESFADLLTRSLEKVGGGKITLDVVEPFDKSLINLSVIRGNWFDEGGEAMKWSDVLASMLQWCGCRLTQWRDKWYVNDFRHVRANESLDSYNCLTNPTMSLTEVHQKNKLEVSLYEDGDTFLDAFDGWELIRSERYFQPLIEGAPANWDAYLSFFKSPIIKQLQYIPSNLNEPIAIEDSGSAMSKKAGTWLVASSSGEFKQHPDSDKIEELEDYNQAKKYIVVATPHQQVAWRDSVLNGNIAPSKYPALTMTDPIRRVYRRGQILIFNATVLMSTNPTPVLCRNLNGEYYNGVSGKTEDYKTEGVPTLLLKIRIGDKELGYVSGGVPGWNEDKTNVAYNNIMGISLSKVEIENPFNQDLSSISNVYQFHIASDGYGFYLDDGLEGNLEIDVMLYSGDQSAESAWISSLNISIGFESNAIDKLEHDTNSLKDVVYETETDDKYTEPYELNLRVSTIATDYNYSRSAVYENTSGVRKPVAELACNVTGERDIAEHHLLNAITIQNQQPRMVLEGTWRNLVASPVNTYVSANLGKTFIVESLEVDCDASTSTMKLEELYANK